MESFSIQTLVVKPTWKEILLDLIHSNQLDPWNIDIVAIADMFFKTVKERKTMDLHLPANIILASSILLKYKSEVLRLEEDHPQAMAFEMEEAIEEAIPQLVIKGRIPPKRQITLDELITEMERVIKYDTTERIRRKPTIPQNLELTINDFDIETKMDELYEKVKGSADAEGLALFSDLLEKKNNEEIIYTLLPLLHLTQRQYIDIFQEEFFGEIFIRVLTAPNQ